MTNKDLTFCDLRMKVYSFIKTNYKQILMFVMVNFLFLTILLFGIGGVGSLWFLVWGIGYYLLHFFFFRWAFKRSPYLFTRKFFGTLLPAVKVMVMILLGLTLLAYLPYFPLLFGGTSETFKKAITLFIGDFMGDSNAYNFMISMIMLLMSPLILYRPLLGWIAAVIGRSGSFRNIFKHTYGCYGLFLKISVLFYVIGFVLWSIDYYFHLQGIVWGICLAPFTIVFNVFLVKTYEVLFLD
jgi:hypothetical protein